MPAMKKWLVKARTTLALLLAVDRDIYYAYVVFVVMMVYASNSLKRLSRKK